MAGGVRVAIAMVSNSGFRDPADNDARLGLAAQIARASSTKKAAVAVLPAGFVIVDSEHQARKEAKTLARLFAATGLGLIAGVDLIGAATEKKSSRSREVRSGTLPYLGFASSPKGDIIGWWRQRSTTRTNAHLAPDRGEERIVTLRGLRVAPLICGEIFSAPLRRALVPEHLDLVIDIGHSGMGRGFQASIPSIAARNGAVVVNAQHMSEWRDHPTKWCATGKGESETRTDADVLLGTRKDDEAASGLWAELVVWEVPKRVSNKQV